MVQEPVMAPTQFLRSNQDYRTRWPEAALLRSKKLVELRWFDGCCGEHGVCLPAMVDLVLEEMHEQAVAPFALYPRIAIDPHGAAKEVRRQCIADCDQALVDDNLSTLQLGK